MLLKNGNVLGEDFEFCKRDIHTKGEVIADISSDDTVIDCTDCFVVPGLIDIHSHGAVGFDNMDASYSAIDSICNFMGTNGVTTYIPTLITGSFDNLSAAAANIKNAAEKGVSGANIGGIHMEGPYFSLKYKGAQNEEFLRKPDIDEFDKLYELSGGMIKIISIAPETEGAEQFIDAEKKKVKISLGHTDADYQTAMSAIEHGASGVTHIFNGMRGFHHRNPNVIGAAFESDVMCECICDGFHLSSSTIKLLYKMVGKDRLVLISDSLRATGMADGEYELGGQRFYVQDGKARLTDGTIAGSTVRLLDCVKKAIEFGIPTQMAFQMATKNPAKAAGLDKICGIIKNGFRTDLLILNRDLSIKNVIIRGRVFR